MEPFVKLFILFLCFTGYSTTSGHTAYSNGTIKWTEKEPIAFKSSLKTTFDAEGLGPWYNLANSFINTVLNKEPWGIAKKAMAGIDKLDIEKDIITGYALGIIITVGFGMLFCIFMPIVGFCFCCCRCCGNCGGEMTQKDSPRNGCKRAVFGLILCLITLLMFAGVLLTFVCNDNLSKTLTKAGKASKGIVEDTTKFINNTINEFDSILKDDLPFVMDRLKKDISDAKLRQFVGDPFLALVDKIVEKPIQTVVDLSKNAKKMEDQLDVIVNNTKDLRTQADSLSSGLNAAETNISGIITDCGTLTVPPPDFCGIDQSELRQGANFTNVPDVEKELKNVRDVTNLDFIDAAQKGLQTLKDIPETMINKTHTTRKDIDKMIANGTKKGNDILDDMRSSSNKAVLDPLKNVDKVVKEYVGVGKKYDKYRWYAGVGLTCLLLLIVVLMALGLMCGICGHDKHDTPSSRGTVSNMGGNCLMAATGFCFIFASFLMLLTTICFMIGAPMRGIVCAPIQDGKLFSEFLDNKQYFNPLPLNNLLKSNKTDFKIGEVLENCRKNEPAYTALRLEYIFNISKLLNIKELLGPTVDKQFESLKVNLTDQTLLKNDSKESLKKLNTSGVDDINFEKFTNETRKGITKGNLTVLAQNLDTFANNMTIIAGITGNATVKARVEGLAAKATNTANGLRELDKNVAQAMAAKSVEMDANVVELKKIGANLGVDATNALNEAEKAEKSLHSSSAQITKLITDYKDRVLGYGYQLTDHILYLVKHKLGRCQPLTNIFDAVVVLACDDFLHPFNGFWLGIGFCLFFFIPSMIFSVKLAKHYRRMNYESDFDEYGHGHDDMIEMGQPVGQEKKLWANPKHTNGTRQ